MEAILWSRVECETVSKALLKSSVMTTTCELHDKQTGEWQQELQSRIQLVGKHIRPCNSAGQLDGRLENCWIDEPSDNDMLECSAQDESDRNGSKVSMFLRCSGSGNWSVAVHWVQPIYHLATGYANPLNWHTTYALAYHFLRYKMTQQTYSLHAVYIILYKELLVYNFRHFPNLFTISFES